MNDSGEWCFDVVDEACPVERGKRPGGMADHLRWAGPVLLAVEFVHHAPRFLVTHAWRIANCWPVRTGTDRNCGKPAPVGLS